jgi:hypothetical protein
MAIVEPSFQVTKFAVVKKRRNRSRRNFPVVTRRLLPQAEQAALKLAGGDRTRFRVINDTTVIVVNKSRRQS